MIVTIALAAVIQFCSVQKEAKLLPNQAQGGAFFGWSIDLEPGRLVVGAPGQVNPSGGLKAGVAYVFEKFGSSWSQQALLADSHGITGPWPAEFGKAVALDGERVAVGAPLAYLSPPELGRVYLFTKQGNFWTEEALLEAPNGQITPFGSAVDLEGDTLLVGCPTTAGFAWNSPTTAYIYERGPTGWSKQAMFQPSGGVDENQFGWAVALQGDTAFIGSPGNPNPNAVTTYGGVVYVYRRIGKIWSLRQQLGASDGMPGDFFGGSLSVEGTTLIVTARHKADSNFKWAGAAYEFQWNGNAWVETNKIVPHGRTPSCMVGRASALSGDMMMLAGMDFFDSPTGGAFYLFTHAGNQWIEHLKIPPGDGNIADNFGFSMALMGSTVAVAAPRQDALAIDSGSVYIFTLQTSNLQSNFYCSAKPSGTCTPRILHLGQPSVSGAVAGEQYELWAWEMPYNVKGLLVYSVTGPASTPFQGGTLCLSPPAVRTQLQTTQFWGAFGKHADPCFNSIQYDFNARIKSGVDPALKAGQQVWFQYWARDPGFAPPNNVSLTDGLTVIICQ
jgi:hypothetical protein